MSTSHQAIPTTNPNYATGSGLILEIKFADSENWQKLANAEPYAHNKPVAKEKQVEALERARDKWISEGTTKYRNASYRIGGYKYFPELGYAWEDAPPTKRVE